MGPEASLTRPRERDCGADVLALDGREVGQDLLLAHTAREVLEDVLHRDACAADAGLPAPDSGIDRDALLPIHAGIIRLRDPLATGLFGSRDDLSGDDPLPARGTVAGPSFTDGGCGSRKDETRWSVRHFPRAITVPRIGVRARALESVELKVESEREEAGRWIAEIVEHLGVLASANTAEDSRAKAEALLLRGAGDLLEHGEAGPQR
jgi:hypothetical protein